VSRLQLPVEREGGRVFLEDPFGIGDERPLVSVLVVDFNAGPLLEACLRALEHQTLKNFEVLLVNNGEAYGPAELQGFRNSNIRVIHPERNLGFAAANNLAARAARAPWIATLNPDAFAAPDWLEQLIKAGLRHPGVASFACAQRDQQCPDLLDGAGDAYSPLGFAWRGGKGQPFHTLPPEGTVFGPCAAAALYRRDAFFQVGGFDESFFCYYEDVDLAFRLRLAGHSCVFVPEARVDHVGSAVSGAESPFSVYHITRNRVWTLIKDMPASLLTVLCLPVALVLLRSLLRTHSRTKAKALFDAARGLRGVLARRRDTQVLRSVSLPQLAQGFTWSWKKTRLGTSDVRPVPPVQPLGDDGVCAVVVTYQTGQRLRRNLTATLDQVDAAVVVDNGSDRETHELLAELALAHPGKLSILANGRNLGLARAQNQGIARAIESGFRWVLLLDDDSTPFPGMVAALLRAYRVVPRNKPVGLVTPRVERTGLGREQSYAISEHPMHLVRRTFGERPVLRDLIFAIASGSLIPVTALEALGGMREEFFIDYVDVDFCLRLRQAGYTILSVSDALLGHRLGNTEAKRAMGVPVAVTHHSASRRYYIFRNRVVLWREWWRRWPSWTAFDAAAAFLDLIRILFFEKDRAAKLRAAFRGTSDGIRGRLHSDV